MKINFSCLFLFISFLSLFAAPIRTYQELTAAIRTGERFVILLDLQGMDHPSGFLGYFIPKTMMLVPAKEPIQEHVSTSFLHFSDHSGKPTYEYVKYTINSDLTVVIHTTFYDPEHFQRIGKEHTVHAFLGNGVEIFSNNEK